MTKKLFKVEFTSSKVFILKDVKKKPSKPKRKPKPVVRRKSKTKSVRGKK